MLDLDIFRMREKPGVVIASYKDPSVIHETLMDALHGFYGETNKVLLDFATQDSDGKVLIDFHPGERHRYRVFEEPKLPGSKAPFHGFLNSEYYGEGILKVVLAEEDDPRGNLVLRGNKFGLYFDINDRNRRFAERNEFFEYARTH